MIIITGSAGFIGSCVVSYFNARGHTDLVLVDDFSRPDKNKNLTYKLFLQKIDRTVFMDWLKKQASQNTIEFIIHLGARTDTTEFNEAIFEKLNVQYSKEIWTLCAQFQIPLLYASSAATYGAGEYGYEDDEQKLHLLKPLNPYGWSKHQFDLWAIHQVEKPPFWVGLKFFNVFGPNEYHKGRMASVVFHAFHQIKNTGKVKLFRSHHPKYKDGEQLRDFVYVKDVVKVIYFIYKQRIQNGIYNIGTGKARTFLDLSKSVFRALNIPENIEFIDTPQDIQDKYQYFTEAKMHKLRTQGYTEPFTPLEEAVEDYVQNYLIPNRYY